MSRQQTVDQSNKFGTATKELDFGDKNVSSTFNSFMDCAIRTQLLCPRDEDANHSPCQNSRKNNLVKFRAAVIAAFKSKPNVDQDNRQLLEHSGVHKDSK